MSINPRSIAVDGIGFGVRAISVLGLCWLSIDVVPPGPPIIEEFVGGGFVVPQPAKLRISIKINGKFKTKEYEISDSFYSFIVTAKLKDKFEFIFGKIIKTVAKLSHAVKLTKIDTDKPEIRVGKSKLNFKIRRKK